MAFQGGDIILQPFWKIHNIDWSDRRNVFETDPSKPTLDLLRRNCLSFRPYDLTNYYGYFETYEKAGKHCQYLTSAESPLCKAKWVSFTVDIVRTTA